MRLTHFFRGSLGREEVASAFLAMALEGCHRFRDYFLSLVASPELADSLKQRKWQLSVEEHDVDVRMESDDIVILIENKISSAAKKKGQLLRYYMDERARSPDRTIVCLYLAPGDVGQDEVLRVEKSPDFRKSRDYAQHVSWDAVLNYEVAPDDVVDRLVESGLAEIRGAIDRARQAKYPPVGERGVIRNVVDEAIALLCTRTSVPLRRWSGRDFEEILTARTHVTMWLDVLFEVEEEPPFAPRNTRDEARHLQVVIRSQFKLAGGTKASSALGTWWNSVRRQGGVEVPNVGRHVLREDGWFSHDT
ncbi:MAG: PD-(D/E)XK nuclease family protein, partial [Anaerolineae bacterium]